jgi:hypothetical protein
MRNEMSLLLKRLLRMLHCSRLFWKGGENIFALWKQKSQEACSQAHFLLISNHCTTCEKGI